MNTKEKNEYAIRNILQSIDNAATYCSYLGDTGKYTDLHWELVEMIKRFKKRVEKKINDNL